MNTNKVLLFLLITLFSLTPVLAQVQLGVHVEPQNRVKGTCVGDSAIGKINKDGSVSCNAFNSTTLNISGNFIPYNGATKDVDLGSHEIRTYNATIRNLLLLNPTNYNDCARLTTNAAGLTICAGLVWNDINNKPFSTLSTKWFYTSGTILQLNSTGLSNSHTHSYFNITGNQNMSNTRNITNVNRIAVGSSALTTTTLGLTVTSSGGALTLASNKLTLGSSVGTSNGGSLSAFSGDMTLTSASGFIYLQPANKKVNVVGNLNMSNVGNITNTGNIITRNGVLPSFGGFGSIVASGQSDSTHASLIHVQMPTTANANGGFSIGYGAGVTDWLFGESKNIADTTALVFYEDALAAKARFTIATGGKIGVNTTSPDYLLTVNGNQRINKNLNMSNIGNITNINTLGVGGIPDSGYEQAIIASGTGNADFEMYGGGKLGTFTINQIRNSYTRLTSTGNINIMPTSNVGIFTLSPTATLDVNGSTHIRGILNVSNNAIVQINNLSGTRQGLVSADQNGKLYRSQGVNYYGGAWFDNESGVTVTLATTFRPYNFTKATNLKGFKWNNYNQLQCNESSGEYSVSYSLSSMGTQNHIYFSIVKVNGKDIDSQGKSLNNTKDRTVGQASNHFKLSSIGLLYLKVGDNVTVETRDSSGVSTSTSYHGNVNILKVG